MYILISVVLFIFFLSLRTEFSVSRISFSDVMKKAVARGWTDEIYEILIPIFSYERSNCAENKVVERQICDVWSFYEYAEKDFKEQKSTYEFDEEERIYLEGGKKLESKIKIEEGLFNSQLEKEQEEKRAEAVDTTKEREAVEDIDLGEEEKILQELLKAENDAEMEMVVEERDFVPSTEVHRVDVERLLNYETLIREIYTIDQNTVAGSEELNAKNFLDRDLRISKMDEGPQILIYHTHSQEAFCDSIPGDETTTIVGVGEYLKQLLEEEYGYVVLHHKGEYDVESRDDAYSRALPCVEQVLKDNPSIQVIIDLHRDQMPEKTKLVVDVNGKQTAKFMLFNGLSRTRKTGNISYLYNENKEDNLAFSFQMKVKAMEYYPGLTRKIYLKGYRYNMHLRPRTLLIELGAQNNTLEEAMNACGPIAHLLDLVLTGEGDGNP